MDDVVWARLGEPLRLLGLQGQHLGAVRRCALDLHSGRIHTVELCTPWQTLSLPWERVTLREPDGDLQLLPQRRVQDAYGREG